MSDYQYGEAVSGYCFHLRNPLFHHSVTGDNGADVRTLGYLSKDGLPLRPMINSPYHLGSGLWSATLTTGETQGMQLGLLFLHPSAIPVYETIKTGSGVYFADINFSIHDLAGTPFDAYTVNWFKNGSPLTSGRFSNQQLTVYRVSGATLTIDGVGMSFMSPGFGIVEYNESSVSARQLPGFQYYIQASAFIDGKTRNWAKSVYRDLDI